MYHRSPIGRSPLPLLAILAVAGCATGPRLDAEPGSDTAGARAILAERASEGPVLIEIADGFESISKAEIAVAVEDGIRGLEVELTTAPERAIGPERIVLATGLAGTATCGADPFGAGDGFRMALCRGERPVAVVRAELAGEPMSERALWRAAAALFPDDYAGSYGFGWLGNRVSIGVGIGF